MIRSAHETLKAMQANGELPEKRDPEISKLLSERPNPQSLIKLMKIKPAQLGPSDRVDFLTAFEKHVSWINYAFQEAVVAVAGENSATHEKIFDGVDQSERDDVATALRIPATSSPLPRRWRKPICPRSNPICPFGSKLCKIDAGVRRWSTDAITHKGDGDVSKHRVGL